MTDGIPGRSGTRTRWHVLHDRMALRVCDRSFFHQAMAIPLDRREFFHIADLRPREIRPCQILFEGGQYPAHFIRSDRNQIHLSWRKDLGARLGAFQEAVPVPWVLITCQAPDLLRFEMLLGSQVQKYTGFSRWLLPWNPDPGAGQEASVLRLPQPEEMEEVSPNDHVFLYQGDPVNAITHLGLVRQTGILHSRRSGSGEEGERALTHDRLLELQLCRGWGPWEGLSLEALLAHGLEAVPQGPVRIRGALAAHLRQALSMPDGLPWFPDPVAFTPQDRSAAATLSPEGLRLVVKRESCLPEDFPRRAGNPYVREQVLRRAGGCCQLCGQSTPSLELCRLERGAGDSPENMVALCAPCHRRVLSRREARDLEKLKGAARMP